MEKKGIYEDSPIDALCLGEGIYGEKGHLCASAAELVANSAENRD